MSADPIVIDTYENDGDHDWTKIPPEVCGAIFKVSQGTHYNREAWLARALACARAIRAQRPFLIGGYHFLDLLGDGKLQARYFLDLTLPLLMFSHVDDFLPEIDVEYEDGGYGSGATKQQIEDCAGDFASAITAALGRPPILYTYSNVLLQKGITSRMGCAWLDLARYTETLPPESYQGVGWDQAHLLMWQFAGDGVGKWTGHAPTLPGFGNCDLNVAIAPSGPATIDHLRRATMGAPAPQV
jgi:GH25 family lysozyme M1 (1,4-beta-N-acetylmuramidase)